MLPYRYVVMDARQTGITVPARCAACDAPPTTIRIATSFAAPLATGPSGFRVPYCRSCAVDVERADRRRWLAVATAIASSAAVGLVVAFRSRFSEVAAVLLALALGPLVAYVVARIVSGYPGGAAPSAVHVLSLQGFTWTLFVRRPGWAAELGERNGGIVRELPGVGRPLLGRLTALAALPAVAAGLTSHLVSHHRVIVDNAMTEPVDVWVDGRRVLTAAAEKDASGSVAIELPDGHHVLGESAAGATEPRSRAPLSLRFANALYAPGPPVCYWRSVLQYGSRQVPDAIADREGPMPRSATFSLAGVDDVLRASPATVTVQRSSATYRQRIDRDDACTALVRAGCEDVLDEADRCRRAARTERDGEVCVEAAITRCKAEKAGAR
jgi:hypothetical protein